MSFFTIFLPCSIKKGDLENEHLKFHYWNKEDPAKRNHIAMPIFEPGTKFNTIVLSTRVGIGDLWI